MTALYHQNPYLQEAASHVTHSFDGEDGRPNIVVSESLFYPQGGGQKGDRGWLLSGANTVEVVDTAKDRLSSDQRPLLILSAPATWLAPGTPVTMMLDWKHRYQQMRLHSTVHLHHCMMERLLGAKIPNPVSSDIGHDGTAVNRYETDLVTEELAERAFPELQKVIAQGADVSTRADEADPSFRYWDCLEFTIPCGGTHIKNTREIGELLGKAGRKKGKVRVEFRLSEIPL